MTSQNSIPNEPQHVCVTHTKTCDNLGMTLVPIKPTFFLKRFILLFIYGYEPHPYVHRPEESVGFPGARATGGCEEPEVGARDKI